MRRSTGLSLRNRLALVCGLVTLVSFGLAASAVSVAFVRSGEARIDESLSAQAKRVSKLGNEASTSLPLRIAGRELLAQTVDDNGVVVATSAPLQDLGALPPPSTTSDGTKYRNITAAGIPLRVLETSGPSGSRLQIAVSRADLDASSTRLKRTLAGGTLIAVALALIIGRVLAGRALLPLGRIVQTAQQIGRTGDLDRRVPGAESGDELGRMATVFNGMIGRLKLAQDGQRRFVADASHELKTPITSLSGNLEFLQRPDLAASVREEVVEDLRADVDRLQGLATDLVALARADAGQGARREQLDLDEVIGRAVTRIARSSPSHTISHKLTPVRGAADPEAIDRIVGNLVSNAVRYTPDGTTIDVELTVDGDIEPIATIVVRDDGPGMSDADAARAFDRFHRGETSRGTGGSGLGLAIVEQAARSHRGDVNLETAPGRGCAFIVKIPIES